MSQDASPATPASDVAFTPAVKAIQARKGSRQGYAAMEARGGWRREITPEVAEFIAAQRSLILATASADGQPYAQHRGGPAGFLRVLDARTLGSRISAATGNTSARATSRRTPGPSCS